MLNTKYMGIKLKSPVIVASCGLTTDLDKLKKMEAHGAGAIIMKSIFEEDIDLESSSSTSNLDYSLHSETKAYFDNYTKNSALDKYLEKVQEAVQTLSIPVIGSINCIDKNDWIDYACRLENLGVNGLELNINIFPNKDLTSKDIEDMYIDIISAVTAKVKIPVSVKLAQYWTSIPNFFHRLEKTNIKGIALFNNLYRPDIDIDSLKFTTAPIFSVEQQLYYSLRWIGLMSDELKLDFSATTGIWNAKDAIKQLLVGAKTVQLCSVLYKNGIDSIEKINNEIEDWMKSKGYSSIEDFNGKMAQSNNAVFERTQYLKSITGNI